MSTIHDAYQRRDRPAADEAISRLYAAHPGLAGTEFDRVGPWNMSTEDVVAIVNDMPQSGAPQSPMEKTWLRKGIERELVDAVNEGRQQLAIPISGEVADLQRAPGVQKWYETQVLNTAKKIAKQTGSDFEIKTVGVKTVDDPAKELQGVLNDISVLRREVGTVENAILASDKVNLEGEDLRFVSNTITNIATADDEALKRAMGIIEKNLTAGSEGTQYAVIKPKGEFSTTLYATPSAGALAAYTAYEMGKSDQEVINELKTMGFEADDMPDVQKQMDFITSSLEAGHSIDEITEFMSGKEVKADVAESRNMSPAEGVPAESRPDGTSDFDYSPYPIDSVKGAAYGELVTPEPMTAKRLVSALETLHPTMVSDAFVSIPAFFGNEGALRRYDVARDTAKTQIVDVAKRDFGVDLVWQAGDVGDGNWYRQTEQGLVEITPGFWDEMKRTSGEAVGGIAGAIAGFTMAPPHPVAKAAGGVIGGIVGAMSGSQVDYLRDAITIHQDMEAEAMVYRAFNAAEVAAVGEVIGYGVAKSLGQGWKAIKRAKDAVFDGNSEGAYTALKETLFMEDEDIAALVANFKKLNPDVKGTDKQVAIQAVALTEPGVQSLVKSAGALDATATNAAITSVDRRAKEVLSATADLSDPDVAAKFKQDLTNYSNDVKDFYGMVKAQATQQPNGKAISFNYDKLAIDPILDKLLANIQDPTVADKFVRQMQIVKSKSESRDFGDLIELRQIVNDFLYNKRVVKTKDVEQLRGVIKNIDGAIESNAHIVMENPEEWLGNWREARKQYSQMKTVQATAFHRMMFDNKGKPRPVQPQTVVKGMTKYITALDGSFENVMSKLPTHGRSMYEGAVIDALASKYTLRTVDGSEAIDFVKLADDLKQVGLTTPGARAQKASLLELAETFRNDPAIMALTKSFDKQTINQGLTADLVVKAKFELASNTYSRLRGMLPGKTGREQDLIKQVATLLDNPLDSKASKALANELSSSVNLSQQVKELQRQEALSRAKGKQSGKVKVYNNGKLSGSGAYTTIPMHRIADMDTVKTIADSEAISVYNESLDAILKQHGYLGVVSGTDRIRKLK